MVRHLHRTVTYLALCFSLLWGVLSPIAFSQLSLIQLQSSPRDSSYIKLFSHPTQRQPRGETESTPSDSNFQTVGDWAWGACSTVDLRDHFVLAGSGRSVLAIDMSNPDSTVVVGEYKTSSLIYDIKIHDSVACVLTGNHLLMLDVSDPAHLNSINELRVTNFATKRLAIEYPYAYILTTIYLYVIDIHDALSPQVVGSIGVLDETMYIHPYHGVVYLSYSTFGWFDAIDFRDPAHPFYGSSTFPPGGVMASFATNDTFLFVAVAPFAPGINGRALTLRTYSIANPDSPSVVHVDTVSTDSDAVFVIAMSRTDSLLYIATYDSGLYVVNISDPIHPRTSDRVFRGDTQPLGGILGATMASSADRVVVAARTGLWILARNAAGRTAFGSFFLTDPGVGLLTFGDHYLLVGGLSVLDVSDPAGPRRISALPLPRHREVPNDQGGAGGSMATYGSYLYVQNSSGIEIADLLDIRNPKWVGYLDERITYDFNSQTHLALVVNYGYLYSAHDSIVTTYALCDPRHPQLLSQVPLGKRIQDFVIHGDFAYAASSSEQVIGSIPEEIIAADLTDPARPRVSGHVAGRAASLAIKDTILFNSTRYGMFLYSISRPDSPAILDSIPFLARGRGGPLILDGYNLYVAYDDTIWAFYVRTAEMPRVVAKLTFEFATFTSRDGLVYASDNILQGVRIFRNLRAEILPAPPPQPKSVVDLLQNYPNPYRATTTIAYVIPADPARTSCPHVRIEIYDLLGRLVSAPIDEDEHPGNHAIKWSARGLPSGSYYIRVNVDGSSAMRRTMLVR